MTILSIMNKQRLTKFVETKEHFMTLVLFDSSSIYEVYWNADPVDAAILTEETYVPGACTPLYDAVGRTLTKLEKERHAHEMWSHEMDAFNRATPCATIEERVCFNAELTDEYYDEEPKKKRPKKG